MSRDIYRYAILLLPRAKLYWNRTIRGWVTGKSLVWQQSAILDFKNFNFWSCDCYRVPNLLLCTKFHQNRMIFSWDMRFNDFKDGGPPPSWILEICSLYDLTSIAMLFFNLKFFSAQNFTEIGKWVAELWPKPDFPDSGRKPSWILKICIFVHVAGVGF